ncbi:MAG: trehalose-phosphatase [Syntrophus sp. (in: bacteria)]|nr:trehalose-phosphatase [Syntrophus sp. (in: bacteria)]
MCVWRMNRLETGRHMAPQYYFDKNPLMAEDSDRPVALFLDFDGTLVPIRKDPRECYLSSETRGRLESILSSGKSVVAFLSGRSLSDLRKRVSVRGAYYAGNHGLEISGPGIRFAHKDARLAKPVIDAIRRDLTGELGAFHGILIENKRFSFALHYRGAAASVVPPIRKSFYRRIAAELTHARSITVIRGKKVLELVPRVSWNKGAAALHIMQRLDGRYLPICVGDDSTDETLFETFCETGITIRIGPSRRTAARYHLKGQWEVPLLLKQIDEGLR